MRCCAISASMRSGSHLSMITAPMPAVSGVVKHSAKGPVWYSGPVASARSVPLSGSNWNTAVEHLLHLRGVRRVHRRTVHALRSPRGARGVEHGGAERGVGDVAAVHARERIRPARVVRQLAADGDAQAQARDLRAARRHGGHARVEEQRLRLGVLHDVADVLGREVPVDRREPQARAVGGETHHRELAAVAAHQRHGVAGGEPRRAHASHQAVRLRVQFGEAHRALVRPQRDAPGLRGGHRADLHALGGARAGEREN